MNTPLQVPAQRRTQLRPVLDRLRRAQHAVLTTHVNADGDGAGSEVALAGWLRSCGCGVTIVNPTPFPAAFRFLLDDPDLVADAGSVRADSAIARADVLVVLDTAEPARIGRVAKAAKGRDVVIVDHHVAADSMLRGILLQDATACATGELVRDLIVEAGMPKPWPRDVREALYTAIVTDTGSFRFSNTNERTHHLAGELLAQGVDPESMYRHIFGTVPLRRLHLLRQALGGIEVDEQFPITSISLERSMMADLDATSEDLDGIIEHARSVEGTEVAILFRETSDGSTKISLRSAGAVDVNAVARQFGGGGHVKASGALVPEPLDRVKPRVMEATRQALREADLHFRTGSGAR